MTYLVTVTGAATLHLLSRGHNVAQSIVIADQADQHLIIASLLHRAAVTISILM